MLVHLLRLIGCCVMVRLLVERRMLLCLLLRVRRMVLVMGLRRLMFLIFEVVLLLVLVLVRSRVRLGLA
jgi:hypothetical protein